MLVVIGITLEKPDRRFENVIKQIDEVIKKNELELVELKKQKSRSGKINLCQDVIEVLEKFKWQWLRTREGYIQLSEKFRYDNKKLKNLQTDWSNYVYLIERIFPFNPYPSEKDHRKHDLVKIRMGEIEKRLNEELPKIQKWKVDEIKKEAEKVLSYLD